MLPNLIIIGAMKCGTTSLHQYLSLHPEIFMSVPKELNFFRHNWHLGRVWYEAHFTSGKKNCGESSPHYTHDPEVGLIAERMFSVLPNAKLIYLVRDPLQRLESLYKHSRLWWAQTEHFSLTFENLIKRGYVTSSCYYAQLQKYLKYYPREQIRVIPLEALNRSPDAVLRSLYRFLGVDDTFKSKEPFYHKNSSAARQYRTGLGKMIYQWPPPWNGIRHHIPRWLTHRAEAPRIKGLLKKRLLDVLRSDADALREWTGESFEGWSL